MGSNILKILNIFFFQHYSRKYNNLKIWPEMVTLALSFQGVGLDHRDKTRVQMAAKMFPHLKLLC